MRSQYIFRIKNFIFFKIKKGYYNKMSNIYIIREKRKNEFTLAH